MAIIRNNSHICYGAALHNPLSCNWQAEGSAPSGKTPFLQFEKSCVIFDDCYSMNL